MVTFKYYDEKTKTQETWHNSSMFIYAKMVEHEDENAGDLTIVFKGGGTYLYKDVAFGDYVLLMAGGTDASDGKTLNKIIKGKYEFEKLDKTDTETLEKRLMELRDKASQECLRRLGTYFISGHGDVTPEEFEVNYMPAIDEVLENTANSHFVVGDFKGVDIMAQNYLIERGVDPDRITVYHMFDTPRNINPKITNTSGGFKDDDERDAAMTKVSAFDIAFVRDPNKLSGTAKNILRRYQMITGS